ncbi:MAG: hypothetical protein HWN66_07925 [Candidatus Helarchaeota archaeon]|nr:hypothetical protein [Candidatus Helarchaeota archaeon]
MTKSSRRKDQVEGRPIWVATHERCEECGGEMVQTGRHSYSCTVCGLVQYRHHKQKLYHKCEKRQNP